MDTPFVPNSPSQLAVPSVDIVQIASDNSSILENGELIAQGRRLMGTALIGVIPYPKKIDSQDSRVWNQLIEDCKDAIEKPAPQNSIDETFRRFFLKERNKIKNVCRILVEDISTWDEFFEISEGEIEEDEPFALSENIENRWDMNSYFESLRISNKDIRRLMSANIANAVPYDSDENLPFFQKELIYEDQKNNTGD